MDNLKESRLSQIARYISGVKTSQQIILFVWNVIKEALSNMAIKEFDNKFKKMYCGKDTCDIIQTGLHHDQYHVCKTCKEEVSDAIKDRWESRNKINAEIEAILDSEADDADDMQPFFGFYP